MKIDDLLKTVSENRASDLHIKEGRPPMMRIDGKLYPMNMEAVSAEVVSELANSMMDERQKELFGRGSELDLAHVVPEVGRFRANVFRQRGTVEIVMRLIPMEVPKLDELHLPEVLKPLALKARGLVLVTGATGSGKSTSLAAMLDHINRNRQAHIITVEDPMEYVHVDRKCSISQREVGIDTENFVVALKYILRQDPDVILIGEMRDVETVAAAITAAETGHLVLSTLHTIDTIKSIERMLDFFPAGQQDQVRMQLANTLEGIVSLRLLPKADGVGRVPAAEVMVATPAIRALITEGKIKQISGLIEEGGAQYGMQTFDQALAVLCKAEMITRDEALNNASSPSELDLALKGISTSKASAQNILAQMNREQMGEEAAKAKEIAKRYMRQGRFAEARSELNKILGGAPDDEEANKLMAEVREKLGGEDKSGEAMNFVRSGLKEYKAGHMNKAIVEWRRALEVDPENKMAKGYISSAEGIVANMTKAKQAYEEGQALALEGKHEQALARYKEARSLDPGNEQVGEQIKALDADVHTKKMEEQANLRHNKAVALFQANRLLEAGREWQVALECKPDWGEVKAYQKQLMDKITAEGIPDLGAEVKDAEAIQEAYKAAVVDFIAGQVPKAIAALEEVFARSGNSAALRGHLEAANRWAEERAAELHKQVDAAAEANRVAEARGYLQEVLHIIPGEKDAVNKLAVVKERAKLLREKLRREAQSLTEANQNEQALAKWQEIVEIDPEDVRAKQKVDELKGRISKMQEILGKI